MTSFFGGEYRTGTYDPEGDGKTRLDHVKDMLLDCVVKKKLPFGQFLWIVGMLQQ